MLKIKDNIDLKELEKFGFKKYRNESFSTGINNNDETELLIETEIINNKKEKTLFINPCTENPIIYREILDILYDFIKANLVEKIEE